ncbi:MAG: hypothetical protein ABID61_03860 [Candidatus Micrarchaeota archaeon]
MNNTVTTRTFAPVRKQEPPGKVRLDRTQFRLVPVETEGLMGNKKPDFPLMGDGTGGPTPRCSW